MRSSRIEMLNKENNPKETLGDPVIPDWYSASDPPRVFFWS